MSAEALEQELWDELLVIPQQVGEQASRAKRKGTHLVRDSMKQRNALGYPGSKRHRYWMNEFFLLELNKAVTGNTEVEFLADDEWFFPAKPPTPLRSLHEDTSLMKAFAPFIDITEAEQDRLLSAYSGESGVSLDTHLHNMRRGRKSTRRHRQAA